MLQYEISLRGRRGANYEFVKCNLLRVYVFRSATSPDCVINQRRSSCRTRLWSPTAGFPPRQFFKTIGKSRLKSPIRHPIAVAFFLVCVAKKAHPDARKRCQTGGDVSILRGRQDSLCARHADRERLHSRLRNANRVVPEHVPQHRWRRRDDIDHDCRRDDGSDSVLPELHDPAVDLRAELQRPLVPRTRSSRDVASAAGCYFNGTMAVTSISTIMPGQASWLIVSSVWAGRGWLPKASTRHLP